MKYNTILQVIGEYVEKCWSKSQIQEKLSALTDEEKNKRLSELLNPLQFSIYKYWKKQSEDSWIRNKEDIKLAKEIVFNVERKLFEKQKTTDINVDYEKYNALSEIENENRQIESQEKIKYTPKEISSLKSYFGPDYELINSFLYNYGEWNFRFGPETRKERTPFMNKKVNHISKAIKKNKTVESMTVYRGGMYDPSKGLGDTITFKGFTSCTFSEAESHQFLTSSNRVLYRILLPKGTPCLAGNGKYNGTPISSIEKEKEILLDKNFKGKVVDITDNIVTIEAI